MIVAKLLQITKSSDDQFEDVVRRLPPSCNDLINLAPLQEVRKQLERVMEDKALLEEEMAGLQSKLSTIGEFVPLPPCLVVVCHGDGGWGR